jgi:hypothetical protein
MRRIPVKTHREPNGLSAAFGSNAQPFRWIIGRAASAKNE